MPDQTVSIDNSPGGPFPVPETVRFLRTMAESAGLSLDHFSDAELGAWVGEANGALKRGSTYQAARAALTLKVMANQRPKKKFIPLMSLPDPNVIESTATLPKPQTGDGEYVVSVRQSGSDVVREYGIVLSRKGEALSSAHTIVATFASHADAMVLVRMLTRDFEERNVEVTFDDLTEE